MFILRLIGKPALRLLREADFLAVIECADKAFSVSALAEDHEILNVMSPVTETDFEMTLLS